jgi:hypothetical protein
MSALPPKADISVASRSHLLVVSMRQRKTIEDPSGALRKTSGFPDRPKDYRGISSDVNGLDVRFGSSQLP